MEALINELPDDDDNDEEDVKPDLSKMTDLQRKNYELML